MSAEIDRRVFVKGSVLASAGAALAGASGGRAALGQQAASPPASGNPPGPQAALPRGKIGKLEVSRLLLGGNLLTHATHSRDLRYVSNLAAHYNTPEKILETLALAEQQGINTLVIHTAGRIVDLLKRHREKNGGKIQWIICPTAPIEDGLAQYGRQVQELVDDGVDAIYLWGVRSDVLAGRRIDLVAKAVNLAKAQGVPSGVGAHALGVIQQCEKHKINADFYIKTFHHHKYPSAPKPGQADDNYREFPAYWCGKPEETAEFMKTVEKPWIAFKVMAAGAIPPQDGFRYALENGADFILAGMFDFEIAEDVRTIRQILPSLPTRARPCRG